MKIIKVLLLTVFVLFFTACQKNIDYSYKLKYNPNALVKKDKPKIFIVPIEAFVQNDPILKSNSSKVEKELKEYLTSNSIEIVENDDYFLDIYYKKLKEEKGLFNPITGKIDNKKQSKILNDVLSKMNKKTSFDYILIPTFTFKRVEVNRTNHIGRWDGISRFLEVENSSGIIITNPYAISLQTMLISRENGLILHNKTGLDFLQKVVKHKSDNSKVSFIRKEVLFKNKDKLHESIQMSLDPFIEFKRE